MADRSSPTPRARPPANPIVIIPARLAATRLPGKPLADIHGTPMIVHVWRRAIEADLGPVLVAAGDAAIIEAVRAAGGEAVLTRSDHPSGTDRIHEAIETVDPARHHDAIVNVQGDLPTIRPNEIRAALDLLRDGAVDIGTLASEITDPISRDDPNIVKAVIEPHSHGPDGLPAGRAFYFTRARAPFGDGPLWHHIGLYAYRREALDRFVTHPPAALERREKLEQLRSLALGLRIDVAIVPDPPLGVDTARELEEARRLLAPARA